MFFVMYLSNLVHMLEALRVLDWVDSFFSFFFVKKFFLHFFLVFKGGLCFFVSTEGAV